MPPVSSLPSVPSMPPFMVCDAGDGCVTMASKGVWCRPCCWCCWDLVVVSSMYRFVTVETFYGFECVWMCCAWNLLWFRVCVCRSDKVQADLVRSSWYTNITSSIFRYFICGCEIYMLYNLSFCILEVYFCKSRVSVLLYGFGCVAFVVILVCFSWFRVW